jgi:hypothetical protein
MPDEPAGKITNDKTGAHQNEAEVTPPIPTSRGDQNSDQNPSNTNHRSYKPKHDCFDWVNLVVLVLTFLAAGGAAFEAKRLADGTDQLIRDAQNTFEVGSRAWISPIAVGFVGIPERGKPIEIGLRYDNVGKTPAIDLHERFLLSAPTNTAMNDGSAMVFVDKNNVCDGVEPQKDAEVAYPSSGGANMMLSLKPTDLLTGQPVPLYNEFMSGDHSLIVQYCIAYRTLTVIGKSAFCYFYKPGLTAGLDLNRCDKGNHAD